jgi:hypothetical protein
MNTQLTIPKDERTILMRNGLSHFVNVETADKIREILATHSGHRFVTISELNITINTADITGVYTMDEYSDLMKIKEGMRKCPYGKWHAKKEECQCKQEIEARKREAIAARKRAEDDRELTPEERAHNVERMAKMRKVMEKRGILASKMHI